MKDVKEPKLSVCVITYNHENYIRQCLQSILDQETNFDFEVIVGDDCSTDGTRLIIQEFMQIYPGVMKPIYQETNTGGSPNYLAVHAAARGEYIAHIDGDDYALPGKLQIQVDFLDQNQNCSFVCHRMRIVSEDGTQDLGVKPQGFYPLFTDVEKLVRNYLFFSHSSKMYRRSANFYDHSQNTEVIDFTYHIEHASTGLIGFLTEILGCYRMNSAGITKVKSEKLYRLFDCTVEGFDRAYELGVAENIVNYGKSRYLVGAAVFCLAHGDAFGFRKYLNSSIINGKYCSLMHAVLFKMRSQVHLLKFIFQIRSLVLNLAKGLR